MNAKLNFFTHFDKILKKHFSTKWSIFISKQHFCLQFIFLWILLNNLNLKISKINEELKLFLLKFKLKLFLCKLSVAYLIYIYNTQNLSFGVWPFIDSTPGGHTDLRPVSSEPVWPKGVHRKKISLKATSGQITEQNVTPLMLFYGKISLHIFAVLFERVHC
jgi:hypothetical protein